MANLEYTPAARHHTPSSLNSLISRNWHLKQRSRTPSVYPSGTSRHNAHTDGRQAATSSRHHQLRERGRHSHPGITQQQQHRLDNDQAAPTAAIRIVASFQRDDNANSRREAVFRWLGAVITPRRTSDLSPISRCLECDGPLLDTVVATDEYEFGWREIWTFCVAV